MEIKTMSKQSFLKNLLQVLVLLPLFGLPFIVGCSSNPSAITYYHLNDATANTSTNVVDISARQSVRLNVIKVPDYLKQSKLVLHTAPHQMHFSASNLWVQTPEKEIRAALIADLNSLSEEHYFTNFEPTRGADNDLSLFIDITHFYPTENSEVLLNGYWTLTSKSNERKDHQFHFITELELDGYGHAVAKQRTLVFELAEQIASQIRGK